MIDELTRMPEPTIEMDDVPEPDWVELWDGKSLIGKFDPKRFILRSKNRGRFVYFDIADMMRRKKAK